MANVKNHGLIHSPIPPSELSLGRYEDREILPSRDWTPYLPVFESQIARGFETMACVSFSALNCLEILNKFVTGKELNFSDRFTAKVSGTNNKGNTLWAVAEAIKSYGLVPESVWPMGGNSFDEYYADIPESVKNEGKLFLSNHIITSEFVPITPSIMYEALGASALQVAIYAYPQPRNGVHPRDERKPTHAVTLVSAEYGKTWTVFDHYNENKPTEHKLAWDYLFWGSVLFNLKPISMQFKEDYLYQLVDGHGGFLMFAKGRLHKLETFEHALAWIVRNGGDVKDKVIAVTQADLIGQDIYSFKGEKL